MVNRWKRIVLVAIICLFSLSLFVPVVSALEQKVYDDAGLLTSSEREALEALATELGNQHNTDILIVTTNDAGGRTAEKFTDDFYDQKLAEHNLTRWDAVIVSLAMDIREVNIAGFYKAEHLINNARIERILDQIAPLLTDEQYYAAFERFITMSADYMDRPPSNVIVDEHGNVSIEEPVPVLMQWWVQIIIALVIASIVVFSLVYTSGGRVTINNRTYLDAANSKVVQRRDRYIRTTVTRVRRPKNNSSGGGGGFGGGRTGGGHSRSSGSRGF